MSGNEPNRDKQYYQNPDYTNEGLKKQVDESKRGASPFDSGRRTGEFSLDPVGTEAKSLEVERQLAGLNKQEEESEDKKKTRHDPRKFEDLLKERLGDAQEAQNVQRITGQEIDALKVSSIRQHAADVQAKQRMNRFFQNLASSIGSIFSVGQKKKTQCLNYGHIAPPQGWVGEFPKCTECGVVIKSRDELRKASAGQIGMEKPWDNELDIKK